jgi:hypothetical protein
MSLQEAQTTLAVENPVQAQLSTGAGGDANEHKQSEHGSPPAWHQLGH